MELLWNLLLNFKGDKTKENMKLIYLSTDQLINILPENRPLYKDSGLWQIRTDDMENVYMNQKSSESFKEFLIRYIEFIQEENYSKELDIDLAIEFSKL